MLIGVPKEIKDHEYRVGLTPAGVYALKQHGHEVWIESGAGTRVGFPDETYEAVGARIVPQPCSAMILPNTWHGKMVPRMFRSNTQRSASAGRSKNLRSSLVVACGLFPPAALRRQSILPKRARISAAPCFRLSI